MEILCTLSFDVLLRSFHSDYKTSEIVNIQKSRNKLTKSNKINVNESEVSASVYASSAKISPFL